MCEVIVRLDNLAEGRKQLRKCGLTGSAIGENDDGEGDIWMMDGEDTAGGEQGLRAGGRRVREESAEEQALRRRRREAVVFSEGVGRWEEKTSFKEMRGPEMRRSNGSWSS